MKDLLSITTLCAFTVVLVGCVKLDFFLFDGDPIALGDYDFTSDDLDGIEASRITSELIPLGQTSQNIHIVYVERDEEKLDPRLDSDLGITVLYSHGNMGNIELYWHRVAQFEDMGFNVLIIDFRGYGASDGEETSEESTYEDIAAAYDYLRERDDVGIIFSVGFSMGGGPAIWLCSPESEREVFACFTESAFTGTEELITAGAGYDFPVQWFLDVEYDNEERIKTVDVPYLLMHGDIDWRVSIEHGDRLWSNIEDGHPLNRYYRVEGAGHRNVAIPSYSGEWLPIEYSHPDEMPPELHTEFEIYKSRIVDFVVDASRGREGL